MKSVLCATLFASGALASPFTKAFEKRQKQGGSGGATGGFAAALVGGALNMGYGRVGTASVPLKVNLPARSPQLGATKTVKIRTGPYKVPNMGRKNILGEEGALWNYPDRDILKPCDECIIVGMNAGLEYPDGKNANIDTGMWLHHYVHFVVGPGRQDATCLNAPQSLPHMVVGTTPGGAERFFSSGNERTPAFLARWPGAKGMGYHLRKQDKFAYIVDLMNENMEDKEVYLTVTYDFIEGLPSGYFDLKPVWFDAAQCSTSEVRAPKQNGSFVVSARPWTANFNGDVLMAAGHLHDGGTSAVLEVNGKKVCTSTAEYGGSPEYINKPGSGMAAMMAKEGGHAGGGHGHSATKHISKMSICMVGESFDIAKLEKGQTWVLKALYDYEQNAGMLHGDGKQSSVMGIMILYTKVKLGTTIERSAPPPKAAGPPKGVGPPKAAGPPRGASSSKGAKSAVNGVGRVAGGAYGGYASKAEFVAEQVGAVDWVPDPEYPKFEITS